MNHISDALNTWKAGQHTQPPPATMSPRHPIDDTTDADEFWREFRARQAANKNLAFTRHRPARYAEASYDQLRPEQNPRGMVETWLTKGPRTLVLAGPSRTGKTTAAYAIANDANASGQWVIARSAADMSAALKPGSDEPMLFNYASNCELLIIDDLGRERVTDWWLEQLQRIVDTRCGNEQRLIVTANTPADAGEAFTALADRYGDPIAERLIDGGGVVVLDGPAVRKVVTEW